MNSTKQKTRCVECRSTERRIIRRYNGHAFCSTCYAREFKHKRCPQCQNIERLPRFNDTAVCRSCEINKPCIRCGKENYSTGKITPKGPACKSCSVYYREVKICPNCGDESQALSKSKHLDHDMAVCPKCQRSVHRNCSACHRHRLTSIVIGKPICNKCLVNDPLKCMTCDIKIPAGRGKECEDCYHRRVIIERANTNINEIGSKHLKEVYQAYSEWLPEKLTLLNASIAINKDIGFFKKLDDIWGYLPTYPILLEYFDPEGLRKSLRVIRFLDNQGFIKIDDALKKEHSEKHQIHRLLLAIEPDSWVEKAITGFHKRQLHRHSQNKTSYRSIRLSLSASLDLLKLIKSSDAPLSQKEIDLFLFTKPGQRANITSFINYLKKQFGLDLSLDIKATLSNKKHLQKMLFSMMIDQKKSKDVDHNLWIKVSLAYYHDLLISQSAKFNISNNLDGSYVMSYKGEDYFIPGILQHIKNYNFSTN